MRKLINLLLISALMSSCLEKIDYGIDEKPTDRLVVEGGLTTEYKPHQIKLSLSGKVIGQDLHQPATGAEISVFDGESMIYFQESESSPGLYFSDSVAAEIAKTYQLSIVYQGEVYEAVAQAINAKPFEPIAYSEMEGGPILGDNPQGFYEIVLPGNFGTLDPYFYYLGYDVPDDWKDDFPYPIPPGFIDYSYELRDTSYLVHPRLETSALFEYGETAIAGLPLGTEIIERRYYTSEEYYDFLRSVTMETDWRGVNLMQSIPANVNGNISNGALGYFHVMDVYEIRSVIEE